MSQGHPDARRYPLGHLWSEINIARRRVNMQMVTESTLLQALLGSVMNGKNGGAHYKKLIKGLSDG